MSAILIEALHEFRTRLESRRDRYAQTHSQLMRNLPRFGNRHRVIEIERAIDAVETKQRETATKLARIDEALKALEVPS